MSEQLIEQIIQSPRLPSLPTVALQVVQLCQDPNVDVRRVVETLSYDPALAAKMLRAINSSAVSPVQRVTTLTQAVVMLGLDSAKTLALGFCLVNGLSDKLGDPCDMKAFWQRSLYAAVSAHLVAHLAGWQDPEQAFLGGLLQDIGVLAMASALGDQYLQVLKAAGESHPALARCERQNLGIDHTQVGAVLAERWNFAPLLVQAIARHEDPFTVAPGVATDPDADRFIRAVAVSGLAADVLLAAKPERVSDPYMNMARRCFGFSRAAMASILKQVQQSGRTLAKLFEVPAGPSRSVESILVAATETLVSREIESRRRFTELETKAQHLWAQAQTDGLTGLANRRAFDQFLADHFAQARHGGAPLALVLMDIDHFKKCNDAHGHQTGDMVLHGVAKAFLRHVPADALAARYGGEEFAMVVPGTDRVAAAQVAEMIRRAVAALPLKTEQGGDLKVTVSLGVAAVVDGCFAEPGLLIRGADKALYAAKTGGRNAVRIYSPRKAAPAAAASA